jgi:hypothetical protein
LDDNAEAVDEGVVPKARRRRLVGGELESVAPEGDDDDDGDAAVGRRFIDCDNWVATRDRRASRPRRVAACAPTLRSSGSKSRASTRVSENRRLWPPSSLSIPESEGALALLLTLPRWILYPLYFLFLLGLIM